MSESCTPDIATESDVTVISLGRDYENLDESLLEDLRDAIMDVADTAAPPKVVLDLSHTKFFGSAFIEIMFRAWKHVRSRGGTFVISGLTPYCAEVVAVTHLDRLWAIYGDRAEAVRTLGTGSAIESSSGHQPSETRVAGHEPRTDP